jgi:hypothetical protein
MGFDNKFLSSDVYVAQIREKHGIPVLASYEDMEQKVLELLAGRGSDIDDAMTLMMNRRVDAKDMVTLELFQVKSPQASADERYVFLLTAAMKYAVQL